MLVWLLSAIAARTVGWPGFSQLEMDNLLNQGPDKTSATAPACPTTQPTPPAGSAAVSAAPSGFPISAQLLDWHGWLHQLHNVYCTCSCQSLQRTAG